MHNSTLPWHNTALTHLSLAFENKRFHHAQLVSGQPGVGKSLLVDFFANGLMCVGSNSLTACGACKTCKLVQAGNHPDKLVVSPEGKSIGVDEVRSISDFLNHSAQQNGHKVAVVEQAHLMTHSAANALLKTLEEPNPNRYLFLTSDDNSRLPATILSRCNHVLIHSPDRQQALSWLHEQGVDTQGDWLSHYVSQPLLIKQWFDLGLDEPIAQLYSAVHHPQSLHVEQVDALLVQSPTLSTVFAKFMLGRVKQALLEHQIEFPEYKKLCEDIQSFMYEQKNVIGLNQNLSVAKLLFALESNLYRG
ncbi:DNA polymerase III subunit delta' [Pseudoalteromonas sp. T1lg65]|uniref:DNA polymerase III subunit delta' n=1 Tax=Pseudoalteromonas sp. T1lg65 TaxID=2077101 RepID=UPI003F7A9E1D